MFETDIKNKVFSQYNVIIIVVFCFIILSVFSVVAYCFYADLAKHKKNEIETLTQQVTTLNSRLASNVNALSSIQKFANYFLQYPQDVLTKPPMLVQEDNHYAIKHQEYGVNSNNDFVRNNLTGIGDISGLNDDVKVELAMANMLTPSFVSSKQINAESLWFYYVSNNRFVSIYPSVNKNSWQYTDELLNSSHAKKILQQKPKLYSAVWSSAFEGSGNTGINASLGMAVFNKNTIAGIVFVDLSLTRLLNQLALTDTPNKGIIILNAENEVMIHHAPSLSKVTDYPLTFADVVPKSLAHLSNVEINNLTIFQEYGEWLVQKQLLPINGWKIIKYQAYKDFEAPFLAEYVAGFYIFLLVLVLFLLFVYWITHQTFVKPTRMFMSHIEYCAQGDPGKIKPTTDWLQWFQAVENIFGQNRSLLQRLTDQNSVLDIRVNEQTTALQEKVFQHERDYALLKSVMNAIPEYIIFNDSRGNIMGLNNAFGEFIGRTADDVIGLTITQILNSTLGFELSALTLSSNIEAGAQKVVKTEQNTYEIYCTKIHSDSGLELGTIGIVRDVTEQYAIQEALERTKDQSEFANKAKSQFLANMSHEIRTPINAIQGMITLLGRSELTNNQRQHIDNAYGASRSLLYLVDQLLDLAKIESGALSIVKESASIDSIIDKAVKLNIGLINKKQLAIFVEISPAVPLFVETDEMRLIQVLTNLLQNAVKFTKEGSIHIRVDIVSADNENTVLSFKIKDTGIGIAKEKQRHLFEAFKQADESMTRQYGGSGLGLSICQQIIHLMDGDISFESDLNQGCEFTIELPCKKANDNADNYTSNTLTICNYGVDLPENLVASIAKFGWKYLTITSFEEAIIANTDQRIVLLTRENMLKDIIHHHVQKHIDLLCICQENIKNISTGEDVLAQLTVPYILQEKPYHRHMLHSIAKSIYRINKGEFSNINNENESLDGLNVLLVEDNLVNQLVAKELLISMKANVIIAENGKIALDLLTKSSVDVVLMDIQMPIMDGLTATRLIREQPKFKDLPIIAMTAHARKEDKENSLAAGMNLHMAKPVKYNTLLNQVLAVTHHKS